MNYKDIDRAILKSIPNPNEMDYEIEINSPEFTFLGGKDQPDFANLTITFIPSETVIELKSLKLYLYQYRDILISYERLIKCIYENLIETYNPKKLKIVIIFAPRGGISSKLTIG